MTVLIILAVLFIALILIIPLIERSNLRMSERQMGKFGRWILPLLIIMAIVQLVIYYLN